MLKTIIERIRPVKVLVAGDLMLDTYTKGKVERISPEAPVPIVHVQSQEERPGGAGNVMINLVSLGCYVRAMGRVGKDAAGKRLQEILLNESVDIHGIEIDEAFCTTIKNRIISDNQQLVRVDFEKMSGLTQVIEQHFCQKMEELLKGIDIVAISDYGKGFLSFNLLETLIKASNRYNIPVIVDPKGIDFKRYKGATLIKPNLMEAYAAARLSTDSPLEKVAHELMLSIQSQYLMITRSSAGISLFDREGKREDFSVHAREVKDVTGAGDTVLAMMACGIGSGLSMKDAAILSNYAAGIAIQKFGCAQISIEELNQHY